MTTPTNQTRVQSVLAAIDSVAVQVLGIAGVVTTALTPTFHDRSWFIALPGVIAGLAGYFSRSGAQK